MVTVVHVVAVEALYCRLYEVAPVTAPQLTVAVIVVSNDDDKPVGTLQVAAAVVVNEEAVE